MAVVAVAVVAVDYDDDAALDDNVGVRAHSFGVFRQTLWGRGVSAPQPHHKPQHVEAQKNKRTCKRSSQAAGGLCSMYSRGSFHVSLTCRA